MRVAIAGCVHGNLRQVYHAIQRSGKNPHLVIMCGDIQACRNENDLKSMSVPAKYRRLGDFHEYYKRKITAPYLTIVVGGNHESSAYMSKLANGGWLAPGIWYMGDSGAVSVGGLKICGISGIWYQDDYEKPHFEHEQFIKNKIVPKDSIYSVYHTRKVDIEKLMQLEPKSIDIAISHDWPRGIEQYGDLTALLSEKPLFRRDIESQKLGNPATRQLLDHLQPRWWVSAHLHVKYTAQYNDTNFLALDKVLPRRKYLDFIDVGPKPPKGKLKITPIL